MQTIMEKTSEMEESKGRDHNSDIQSQRFAGKRFYRPGVLAAYCILVNLPFGTFFYGLNVYRRGDFWLGRIILTVSALGLIGIGIALVTGAEVYSMRWLLPNIVVGICLMKLEKGSYQKAILNGARPARWWPPLLLLAAMVLAVLTVSLFTASDVEEEGTSVETALNIGSSKNTRPGLCS